MKRPNFPNPNYLDGLLDFVRRYMARHDVDAETAILDCACTDDAEGSIAHPQEALDWVLYQINHAWDDRCAALREHCRMHKAK